MCAGAAADDSWTILRCVVAGSRTIAKAVLRTGDSEPARWRGDQRSGPHRSLVPGRTRTDARREVAAWIDESNRDRLDSVLGQRAPIDHELDLREARAERAA